MLKADDGDDQGTYTENNSETWEGEDQKSVVRGEASK